ncbi:hypothetical protein [Tepidibacter mesophilus]|nr:hypothetical protein [Tepidibacter mesophilus]
MKDQIKENVKEVEIEGYYECNTRQENCENDCGMSTSIYTTEH